MSLWLGDYFSGIIKVGLREFTNHSKRGWLIFLILCVTLTRNERTAGLFWTMEFFP